MVHLSPGMRTSDPYPFEELDRRKAAALRAGRPIVDFGVGDPREETPAFIRERGARFAGGEVARLSLTEPNGFLPDLDAVDASTWDRTAILWLNYPNNPTGATAPLEFLRRAADHCRAHEVLLASDEAYCELWFDGEPPASALQ